jgi:hypothetical protein
MVLHVPQDGVVTFKKCLTSRMPARVFADVEELTWQLEASDFNAKGFLSAGDHILLLDSQAKTNELDFTITASGVLGLAVPSPLGEKSGTCDQHRPGQSA